MTRVVGTKILPVVDLLKEPFAESRQIVDLALLIVNGALGPAVTLEIDVLDPGALVEAILRGQLPGPVAPDPYLGPCHGVVRVEVLL